MVLSTASLGSLTGPRLTQLAGLAALSVEQTYAYARQAGFDEALARQMVAIAQRESTLNPDLVGTLANNERSYGLWQINWNNSGVRQRLQSAGITSPDQLLDPATNARAAFALYNNNPSNLNVAWYIDRNSWVTLSDGRRIYIPYKDRFLENLSKLPPSAELEAYLNGQTDVLPAGYESVAEAASSDEGMDSQTVMMLALGIVGLGAFLAFR